MSSCLSRETAEEQWKFIALAVTQRTPDGTEKDRDLNNQLIQKILLAQTNDGICRKEFDPDGSCDYHLFAGTY
ncbi:hypothetical protein TNCV_1098071 [Trichonephila clavipes]|nr:hypothetical protein TNCV_1098071 [Trichonephila clavipes]